MIVSFSLLRQNLRSLVVLTKGQAKVLEQDIGANALGNKLLFVLVESFHLGYNWYLGC